MIDCRDLAGFQLQMSLIKFKEQFGYDEWSGNLNALNDAFRIEFPGRIGFCFIRDHTAPTARSSTSAKPFSSPLPHGIGSERRS